MTDTAGDKIDTVTDVLESLDTRIDAVIASLESLDADIRFRGERGMPILDSHITTLVSLQSEAASIKADVGTATTDIGTAKTLYLAEIA